MKSSTETRLADEFARLAQALESLNGDGRSAAVWSLDERPRLLYAGAHARKELLDAATERLDLGETTFEIDSEPGMRGKVVVCGTEGDRAAYGLFLHGAGQPHLATTIEQLIEAAEKSLGTRVSEMNRTQKQQIVRFLDERGAFLIRKAVEEVAERLGVTRFTIYNYLERESR